MSAWKRHDGMSEGCPPMAGILLGGGLALATVIVQSVAGLPHELEWRRGGKAAAWLTCHLCHWSWSHLGWDLFAFALLSFLSLHFRPSRYLACMILAALLIPLEIQINQPALVAYRGISGIDSALFGLVVAALWQQSPVKVGRWLAAIAGICFLGKTLYEQVTGMTVFVDGASMFVPVPSAHLVGFVTGAAVGGIDPKRISKRVLQWILRLDHAVTRSCKCR